VDNKIKTEIEYLSRWLFLMSLALIGIFSWAWTYAKIDEFFYLACLGFTFFSFNITIIHIKIRKLFKKWK
jgi:hypothetical protein